MRPAMPHAGGMAAQSAAVAGASATVVQAPQAVKTDIAVLKHEREPG